MPGTNRREHTPKEPLGLGPGTFSRFPPRERSCPDYLRVNGGTTGACGCRQEGLKATAVYTGNTVGSRSTRLFVIRKGNRRSRTPNGRSANRARLFSLGVRSCSRGI